MKKSISVLTLLASVALLASCGGTNSSAASGSDTTPSSSDTESTPSSEDTGDTTSSDTPSEDPSSSSDDPEPAVESKITTVNESGEEVTLEAVDGVYTITNTVDDQEYNVYGTITDAIVFSADSSQSAKLLLHDASISNDTVSPVQWLASSKKVKVNAAEGTNSITCTADDTAAVTSENNCDIQGSASLSITSVGTCVSASSVSVEGSGTYTLLSSAKNGLSCKELVLGCDSEGTAEEVAAETFTLDVQAAKTGIKAELNSKSKKGTIVMNSAATVYCHDCATGISSEGKATLTAGTLRFKGNTNNSDFADSEISLGFVIMMDDDVITA